MGFITVREYLFYNISSELLMGLGGFYVSFCSFCHFLYAPRIGMSQSFQKALSETRESSSRELIIYMFFLPHVEIKNAIDQEEVSVVLRKPPKTIHPNRQV